MASDSSSPTRPRADYHHGDLRQALIAAATAIMEETQRWDFSLREVARRAGVSHNAPYTHFPDKNALIAAVGAAGYRRLRERMLVAARDSPSAETALEAIGEAYIRFGTENPAYYRLMFGRDLQAGGEMPAELLAAAEASRDVLRDIIKRGAEDGSFEVDLDDPTSLVVAVLGAWSLVHGFTLLAIDGLARLETDLAIPELGRMLTDGFKRGLIRR